VSSSKIASKACIFYFGFLQPFAYNADEGKADVTIPSFHFPRRSASNEHRSLISRLFGLKKKHITPACAAAEPWELSEEDAKVMRQVLDPGSPVGKRRRSSRELPSLDISSVHS